MMRRNISETFSPEKNLSLLPVSNSDSRRLSRRSNRPAAACGVVALLLLLAGLLWRSRGESTPTVTSVQTDLGVPADALRDIPRSTGPQPTAGKGAESSREAARRAVEKRALAAASKKEEEAMERHVAKQAGAEGAADGRSDFEKYGKKGKPGCVDRNPTEECAAWASVGQCESNAAFMLGEGDFEGQCRLSCRACTPRAAPEPLKPECEDLSPNCKEWASSGECQNNPTYMLGAGKIKGQCGEACGACEGVVLDGDLQKVGRPQRPASVVAELGGVLGAEPPHWIRQVKSSIADCCRLTAARSRPDRSTTRPGRSSTRRCRSSGRRRSCRG